MSKPLPELRTRTIKMIALACLVVFSGYLRDTLFVRIVWHEKVFTQNAYPPGPHWLFNFLQDLSFQQLVAARYIFTVVFMAVFYGLARLLVFWFFYSRNNLRLVNLVFVSVTGIAALLYGTGWLIGKQADVFPMARYIVGVIETPLIIILLFPVLWAAGKTTSVKERQLPLQ